MRRPRTFAAGDAISTVSNYFKPWDDLQKLVEEITDNARWLLISGPWQSGKSSLMFALAEEAMKKGYHCVVTTLSGSMISVANDPSKSEAEASDAFFDRLAERLVLNSKGALVKQGARSGVDGLMNLFQGHHDKEIVWFIDEASLLSDIRRPAVIQTFLAELRTLKQECVSRQAAGSYCLRSFVLVGTPRVTQLIGNLRIADASSAGYDRDDPLGNSLPPLNMERHRPSDTLAVMDIVLLLSEYRVEHDAAFRLGDDMDTTPTAEESDATILKLSKSIWGLTSGHKGMVCSCCQFLVTNVVFSYTDWKRQVRMGDVSRYMFSFKCYSRVVASITKFSEASRQVILQCIETGTSVCVRDLSVILGPLNEGVVEVVGTATVQLASELLRAAFLENCSFTYADAVPEIASFDEAIRDAFPYINESHLTRDALLNANGQPSEYVWRCEFLLALKFVLEKGYKRCNYTIMVEAKRRDENGQRRTRLDFLLKNERSPSKGFELQAACAGSAGIAAIEKHIKKSAGCGRLHGCDMHYVYLQYGNFGVDAKATIEKEGCKFKTVECWFVQYMPDVRKWNIERLVPESGWITEHCHAATSFPKIQFGRMRRQV